MNGKENRHKKMKKVDCFIVEGEDHVTILDELVLMAKIIDKTPPSKSCVTCL